MYDFAQHQSALRSPDVDWAEFFKDYKSRGLYENWINRLDNLQIKMKNAKILHDYDNHQDALADYAYTSYKAGMRSADFEDKHKECKQFFARSKKAKPSEKEAKPTEE